MTLGELQKHVAELVEKYGEDMKLKAYRGYSNQVDDLDLDLDNEVNVKDDKLSSAGEKALMCFYISV